MNTGKIPIVSTDYSDLESLKGSFYVGGQQAVTSSGAIVEEVFEEEVVEPIEILNRASAQVNYTMAQQVADQLNHLRQKIHDEIADCPASDITAGTAGQAEKDRDRIWEKKDQYRDQHRKFLADYGDQVNSGD